MSRNRRYKILEIVIIAMMVALVCIEPKLLRVLLVFAVLALMFWLFLKAIEWAEKGK